MTNKSKTKGSKFEHDAVNILNSSIDGAHFRRIPGSGAIGTSLGESLLTGDISGSVDNFPKKFKVECKAGYNSSSNKEVKQFTLKKEWLDKIWSEAQDVYALPILIGKFDNVHSGTKEFVVMDIDIFSEIINRYTLLQKELIKRDDEQKGKQ